MKTFAPPTVMEIRKFECEAPRYTAVERTPRNGRYVKVKDHYVKSGQDNSNEALLLCTGDMLCEEKLFLSHRQGDKFSFYDIFSFVYPYFLNSDLTIGNLETTICSNSPYTGEQYKIDGKYHCNAPAEFLDAIKAAGFDMLVLANNHNLDSGYAGILETLHHIDERQIMRTGLFKPNEKKHYVISDVNGISIGVLSYSTWYNRNENRFTSAGRKQVLNEYDSTKVKADIESAKAAGAEFVLVYIHWGVDAEYQSVPSESMINMANEIADCGADYIVGSHTHSLMPYKLITSTDGRQVPCLFSLGNFVTSERASISRETGMLQIRLKRENNRICVKEQWLVPCYVPDKYFNLSFPLIPELIRSGDSNMDDKLKQSFSHIRSVIGSDLNKPGWRRLEKCTDYLNKLNICSILGLPEPDEPGEHYTMLRFAQDSLEGCVSVIAEMTSDPTHITSDERCTELADIAIQKGARLLISRKQYSDYPTLIVDDPFQAYCKIISKLREQFSPKTVSITGSIGKTTETEMVYAVISSKFNTHRNTGSANNVRYSGTVVQGLKRSHSAYVQELMEGPPYGAASTISKLVQPQCAVVTRIGSSHMEAFGSQERIFESCLGIQDGMPEDGLLILNADDPIQWNGRTLCDRRFVCYGIEREESDYRAVNIHSEEDWLCFDIKYDNKLVPVKICCFGQHNVLNAVAAFAVGKWVGMSDQEIATGLAKYRTTGIRQNLVRRGGYRIYLDCYNAAPESIEVALRAFSEIPVPEGGRHVGVLADVFEVGDKAEEYHRKIGNIAGNSCLDLLICYGNDARFIAEEAKNYNRFPVYYTSDRDELLNLIRNHVSLNDVTLFKGSHGMELEYVVDLIWGTWYHEEFERYDFKTHTVKGYDCSYCVYTDHATVINKVSTTENLIIPDNIEGLPVTGIERNAFNGSRYTYSVTFPSSLKNIRYCAFYKANHLAELNIPASVRIIDDSAFSSCENLQWVNIAEGCTHIGYRAFGNCSKLEGIIIPESVRQIEPEVFINDRKLCIYGIEGSYAERYARAHNIPFEKNSESIVKSKYNRTKNHNSKILPVHSIMAGSYEQDQFDLKYKKAFLKAMRKKAKTIGMDNTEIVSLTGLSKDTISTPKDMLKMVTAAYASHKLDDIWGGKVREISISGPNGRREIVETTVSDAEFEHCYRIIGGKNGTLPQEDGSYYKALVIVAEDQSGRIYAGCVMGAHDQWWAMKTLFDKMVRSLDDVDYDPYAEDLAEAEACAGWFLGKSKKEIDAEFGKHLLYEKCGDSQFCMAATVKILNLLTAMDYTDDLNEWYTIRKADIKGGSGNIFREDDCVRLQDLMSAAMLPSSNTAANAIARCIGEKIFLHKTPLSGLRRANYWIYRKFEGGIRCYHEHGVKYTARRVIEHLTGRS